MSPETKTKSHKSEERTSRGEGVCRTERKWGKGESNQNRDIKLSNNKVNEKHFWKLTKLNFKTLICVFTPTVI